MRVLAVSQSFAPGFRGGSIQALTYMVERLTPDCEFWVIARDRDPRQAEPLPAIEVDTWTTHRGARVFYSSRRRHPGLLARLVSEAAPEVIFLNSLFAAGAITLLSLRRAGVVRAPVVVAPEGELAPGALAQKSGKKRWYLRLARTAKLLHGVTWVARDVAERADIGRVFPGASRIAVLPCLGPAAPRDQLPSIAKSRGAVKLLYLSRITPKKNLAFLLEVLRDSGTGVDLDIVGPIDDERYWTRCRQLIDQGGAAARVRYHGEAMPEEVPGFLAQAHALVLPSLGENYAYVVAEALESGRPVLVSTETPWHDLQAARAGWTLPLVSGSWQTAIADLRAMSQDVYQTWCHAARAHGLSSRPTADATLATFDLLRSAAGAAG